MTYTEAIEFLYAALPMYHRIGNAAIKKDLTNTRMLCEALDQPQEAFDSIHVAGTNGKGSTSHMLASVFQAAGLKVGLYTSPHYVDFRERIKINGELISEDQVTQFVEKIQPHIELIQPSFFEITVAMAFDHFRNENVDLAVIETGLGGRLDSTNIITPKISVITNIGFDHMSMLGDTLPLIAVEKAGIIKSKVPVVIGEWKKDTAPVFKAKAQAEGAPHYFASRHLRVMLKKQDPEGDRFDVFVSGEPWLEDLYLDLSGPFQAQNLRTVLEAIWRWNAWYPAEQISDAVLRKGLSTVKTSTHMIGRWMMLNTAPLTITDSAHNIHGLKAIVPSLLKLPARKRHFVLGFVSDKDIRPFLKLFPKSARFYWCSPDIPRGKKTGETFEEAKALGRHGNEFDSVKEAYLAAKLNAEPDDLVFVGGSSYVVGNLLQYLDK